MPGLFLIAAGAASITLAIKAAKKAVSAFEDYCEDVAYPLRTDPPPEKPVVDAESEPEEFDLITQVQEFLAQADHGYQSLIRHHLDPLLIGRARDRHLQELVTVEDRALSPQEKRANWRLVLGFGSLGLLGVTYLTGWPLIPIVIAAGVYNLWPWLRESYRLIVEERRIGVIHLLSLYFGSMWIGGYFLVGALGAIFSGLCQKFQVITQIGVRHALVDLLGQTPHRVWVEVKGVECEIPFEQLQIGDLLILDAGQMIPVDGTIVEGWALVDQQRLTGESQPVEKASGDTVFAATVVLGGRLRVRVEKAGADTAAGQIGSILSQTVDYEVGNMATQFASVEKTLWPMLGGGALGLLVGGPITAAALLGCNYVVGIVPLRLITLVNALDAGSNHGILVKDGRALEKLKSIDTLVFDKTGTLTLERPHIVGIHVTGEYTEIEVLSLAATAEYRQVHPIAQAILTAAEERGIELPVIDTAHYEIGYGVKVQVGDLEVMVGSQRFMLMENIRLPSSLQAEIERCKNEGRSLVYVAADGQLAGLIELDATLRPEARAIVDWLRQRGLELYILSGDQEPPTQRLARELSMDGYFANILPEGKAELIEQLQAEGRSICFIGDGINDAIALRQADVSISFRGAANIASDSAQIVLMEDHLDQLRVLFELIQAYDRNLATNYQQSVVKSLIAAAAVLILPLKFLIVEGLWVFTFAKGITLATRPLLKMPTSQSLDSSAAENVERLVRDGDPHL